MTLANQEKKRQLGVPQGTASNRLRKQLLFAYVKRCGDNICYQCGEQISRVEDFSIEHKVPWLHSEKPVELFFDTGNIAFSHIKCNVGAARVRKPAHPSFVTYRKGCRCDGCRAVNRDLTRKKRDKKK